MTGDFRAHSTKSSCLLLFVALLPLLIHYSNIGLMTLVGTLAVIYFCSACVFRKNWIRFCSSAFIRYREGSRWARQFNWLLGLASIHAVLVILQNKGVVPTQGYLDLETFLSDLELELHESFPSNQPTWVAFLSLFTYLCVFPGLLISMIIILDGCLETEWLEIYLIAMNWSLACAIPVFWLIGVPEVWMVAETYTPPVVSLGDGLASYRTFSGPYNCLPSLHNTLSMIAIITGWKTRMPKLRVLASLLGTAVCVSTVHAGVHWFFDVLTSIPFAILMFISAEKLIAFHYHRPYE